MSRKTPDAKVARVVELARLRWDTRRIHRDTGVSESRIREIRRAHQIPAPPTKPVPRPLFAPANRETRRPCARCGRIVAVVLVERQLVHLDLEWRPGVVGDGVREPLRRTRARLEHAETCTARSS